MTRVLLAVVFTAALAMLAPTAQACAICLQGMAPTEGQQLASSYRAVLATPSATGSFDVVATIKGDSASGTIPITGSYERGRTLLAILPSPSAQWLVVGPVTPSREEILRRIAATAPGTDAAGTQWAEYAAFLLPNLRDSEPLVATMVLGELSRVPYASLRTLKPMVDAGFVRAGLDDPSLQILFTLLFGIAAPPGSAHVIEQRLDVAQRARDATNLAALLAADLELRGAAGVSQIEKRYFADKNRSLAEIRAALLALSAQGDADAAVPRARIIAAYRLFMKERKAMAALVAHDLAEWGYWDAGPEFVQLLKTNALPDPASRVAAYAYLAASPRADAKTAARTIAATMQP